MRTILITGASGGLAQEMVKLLPEDRLILLGRNQEKLEQLYASHPQAECIGIDITDSSAVQDLVEELYQRYGQIDILVNNAGYGIFEALIAFLTSRCRRCLRSIPLPSCSFHA